MPLLPYLAVMLRPPPRASTDASAAMPPPRLHPPRRLRFGILSLFHSRPSLPHSTRLTLKFCYPSSSAATNDVVLSESELGFRAVESIYQVWFSLSLPSYRKATLCVHPDKLQQHGATIQQKYISEKVFDLLKEAWNKFNSEER